MVIKRRHVPFDLLEQRALLEEALVRFNFNEHGPAARRAERGGLQAERPRHPALMARVARKPAAASWFADLPAGTRIFCILVSLSSLFLVFCFSLLPIGSDPLGRLFTERLKTLGHAA